MLEAALDTLLRTALFFGVVVVVFAPLEWLESKKRLTFRGRGTDLLHFWLNPLLIAPAAGLVFGLFGDVFAPAADSWFSTWPYAVQVPVVFLIGETSGYWLHRALHRVPWLWRMHRVHHAAAPLDFLAAHRQHPLETLLFLAVINLPAIALGFDFAPVVGVIVLQKLHTVFVHADIATDLPVLRHLIAFPNWHRRHHHIDEAPHNFASLFPWLDRLFGTWAPADAYAPVGLRRKMDPGYFAQLAAPFVDDKRGPAAPASTTVADV